MPPRRNLVALNSDGELVLKSADGQQHHVELGGKSRRVGYVVIDCSGSMAEEKLAQAQRGANDFARSATSRGFRFGVITFADDARIAATYDSPPSAMTSALSSLRAGGGTNMAAGLMLAIASLNDDTLERVVLLVTDGQPNDANATLAAAQKARTEGIQIIAIGTDDADYAFLAALSTVAADAMYCESKQLGEGIASAARLLRPPADL